MGYFGGPNKALTNPCFKRPKLVSFGEKKKNVKEKKRGEEEEEKRKKESQAKKVWKLNL